MTTKKPTLTPEEVRKAVKQEREWLKENGAVSAVTGGPVEDQEGVPLPGDFYQGSPPAHSCKKGAAPTPDRESRKDRGRHRTG